MLNPELYKNIDAIREIYQNANPYPHIVIDNFLSPKILDVCLDEMIQYDAWSTDTTEEVKSVQINKFYSPSSERHELEDSLKQMKNKAPITRAVLDYLYSEPTFEFMTSLTGISNLQGDETWLGAGMHKVVNGGRLAIHADFNRNWFTGLYRRINLLVYLNKDWKSEYGGELEIWNTDMSACAGKIAPIFNRAVIFTTFKNSYHGHPTPMTLPEGVARYSLALYYFTEEPPENDEIEYRRVDWQVT